MRSITIPWGAWYGDQRKKIIFPGHPEIVMCEIENKPPLGMTDIERKMSELPPLIRLKQPESIVIVVDDLTRPLKMARVVKTVIALLEAEGYDESNITFLIGLGGHRFLYDTDIIKKVGEEVVEKYTFVNHSPFENLVELPIKWKGTPVNLNKTFVEADFRIVMSGLVPHNFAGFSGGAKMLFPGIADLEIIKRTHKSVLMGFMGKLGEIEGNRFRSEIEALAVEVGVDYFIGMVGNSNRDIAAMFCGDIITAHRAAAQFARQYYTMDIKEDSFDAVVLNCYPKDTELLQSETAFIPLHSTKKNLVKPGGTVIVTSACSEGIGHHELFGPGKVLYRKPQPKRFLGNTELIFHSENITKAEFFKVYWDGYSLANDWQAVYQHLDKKLSGLSRVLVCPNASLQLVN